MDRKAKNRSEKKETRLAYPWWVGARAIIHDTGDTYAGSPVYLCLACSIFFLFATKRPESVIYSRPGFCPNCGRKRADLNQEDSHDG